MVVRPWQVAGIKALELFAQMAQELGGLALTQSLTVAGFDDLSRAAGLGVAAPTAAGRQEPTIGLGEAVAAVE